MEHPRVRSQHWEEHVGYWRRRLEEPGWLVGGQLYCRRRRALHPLNIMITDRFQLFPVILNIPATSTMVLIAPRMQFRIIGSSPTMGINRSLPRSRVSLS